MDEVCMHDCLRHISAAMCWDMDCLKLSPAVIQHATYQIV